jgi:hypothetical protein
MPELDFAGLRQDAETAFRPHFETVRHRYRRRRRRRTGLAAAGVACLVVAGGALVTQVGPGGGANQAGAGGGYVDDKWSIQVGDLDHLYAPYQHCGPDRGCSDPGLMVSADQGRSWHAGAAPTVPDRWALLAFRALGPQTLVMFGTTAPNYLVSTDAGASWRAADLAPAVPVVPAGWRLLFVQPVLEPNAPLREYTVLVGDPVTGTIAPLTRHLTIQSGHDAWNMPDSAGLWVSGTGTTNVSRDGGATWQTAGVGTGDVNLLGYANGVAYAAAQPHDLYRSVDNGGSWQKVTVDTPPPANANLLNALVLDDGRILVPGALAQGPGEPTPTGGQRGLFVSADGGRTFQATDKLPGAYVLYRVTGGYVAALPSTGIWLSRDGTDWVEVRQPRI